MSFTRASVQLKQNWPMLLNMKNGLTASAIIAAWLLSCWIRLEWVETSQSRPNVQWANSYLPTTHDSYLFLSTIQQSHHSDSTPPLKGHPRYLDNGILPLICSFLIYVFGIDNYLDISTYLPIFLSGLLAAPIVLIGRLYGSLLAGFLAACLAVCTSSYFNRTMAGYLDTDIFSITVPTIILFLLLHSHKRKSYISLIAAGIAVFVFPFFYAPGSIITLGIAVCFICFKWATHLICRNRETNHEFEYNIKATIVLSTAIWLCPYTSGIYLPNNGVIIGIIAFLYFAYAIRYKPEFASCKNKRTAAIIALIFFTGATLTGGASKQIAQKLASYLPSSQISTQIKDSQTLQYKNVMETIIEAQHASWDALMTRITGSSWATLAAVIGYILLLFIFPEFVIFAPLILIGIFSHWGGLRFTVHAIPIAAISIAFLPLCCLLLLTRNKDADELNSIEKHISNNNKWLHAAWVICAALSFLCLRPNISLAMERSKGPFALPSVLDRHEVELLDSIRTSSAPGDYVLSWWDWGSAVWFHTQRNVLTNPSNQSNDSYVFAKMMTTDSPRLAAHLGRTAVEFYHHNGVDGRPGTAVSHLFKPEIRNPEFTLKEIEDSLPVLKTREVFIFLPSRLFRLYPVLHMFSERDLMTGEEFPLNTFLPFPFCEKQAKFVKIGNSSKDTKFLVDLKHLVLCDLSRGLSPSQLKTLHSSRNTQQWDAKFCLIQTGKGDFFYADKLNFSGANVEARLLSGNTISIQSIDIKTISPCHLISKAEDLDNSTTHEAESDPKIPARISLAFSTKSNFALICDNRVFNSMLIQMLVLQKHSPEYFELIEASHAGRVYKLVK